MEIVLTLPHLPLVPARPVARAGMEVAVDLAGDPVAEAVARVMSLSGDRPGAPSQDPDAVPQAYDRAARAVERGETGAAVALLHGLLASGAARPEALMGLSVCAARLSLYGEALVLAIESRRLGVDHPRVWCVAGLCELKRDQRRTAQTYLAAATRSARRSPEFGDDLRAAQRLLLLMHMSQDDLMQDDPTGDELPMEDLVTQEVAIGRSGSAVIPPEMAR